VLGRWIGTVSGQYVPYVVPQEHGLHLDTRWAVLGSGEGGPSLLIEALSEPLAFSVSHMTADDLWQACDTSMLVPRSETIVHLDVAHRGLGTLSCGPDVAPPYRVGSGSYRWRWRLRPFGPGVEVTELRREPVRVPSPW
jgi:beta-galactosidase